MKARRLAIISDGVVTAGLEGTPLAALLHDRERVDVILAGGIRDEHVGALLVRAGEHPGDVFDLDDDLQVTARGLGEVVAIDVPVEVAGATWFSPHRVASMRPGTQVTVFARTAVPAHAFAVTIGGSARTIDVMPATPALLERATARVEIDELETTLATATVETERAVLRKRIEKESIAARIASTQATMLILDSDDDYARYGIDRNALSDILVVGPHGLEQTHRTFVASKDQHHSRPQLSRAEAMMLGNYGTIGHGSGTGSGWG